MLTSAAAQMIRLDLYEDGTLVLHPENRAASYSLTGQAREDVVLRAEQVTALADTVPTDIAYAGWLDIVATGVSFRVPYRLKQTPGIRELCRLLEMCGYPERAQVGQREPDESIPLEIAQPLPLAL